MEAREEGVPKTHLLRFLSRLRRRDDSGVGGVLCGPHELRLGQLLPAVLLHGLGLQLGNASVLGPEDLGGVGLFSHLGGGRFLMLAGVSLCWEMKFRESASEAAEQCLEARIGRIRVRGVLGVQRDAMGSKESRGLEERRLGILDQVSLVHKGKQAREERGQGKAVCWLVHGFIRR